MKMYNYKMNYKKKESKNEKRETEELVMKEEREES